MPPSLADLSVPPALLAEHLAALVEDGHRLVGLTEALASPAGAVALTFDDGYVDFVSEAVPALAAVGATATLYAPSRHVGGTAAWLPAPADALPLLDAAGLREVVAEGHEVGSHGADHVPFDVLPGREADAQLAESRDRLEDATGTPMRSFCYPHGYASRRLARRVAAAGYDNACVIGHRLHRAGEDRHRVARIMVTPATSPDDLRRLVADGVPGLAPLAKQVAGPAWRVARRTAGLVGLRWT
jgi:peptidoglycan/xylan/chitin deacetylase (PgdA/CDA1 family)